LQPYQEPPIHRVDFIQKHFFYLQILSESYLTYLQIISKSNLFLFSLLVKSYLSSLQILSRNYLSCWYCRSYPEANFPKVQLTYCMLRIHPFLIMNPIQETSFLCEGPHTDPIRKQLLSFLLILLSNHIPPGVTYLGTIFPPYRSGSGAIIPLYRSYPSFFHTDLFKQPSFLLADPL
jgi:hypothetical protein